MDHSGGEKKEEKEKKFTTELLFTSEDWFARRYLTRFDSYFVS